MIIIIESIKTELDKLSWSQIIQWGSYVGIPALGWIFSKVIQAMPEPSPTDSMGYIWLYRIGQELGANTLQASWAKQTMEIKKEINNELTKTNQDNPKSS